VWPDWSHAGVDGTFGNRFDELMDDQLAQTLPKGGNVIAAARRFVAQRPVDRLPSSSKSVLRDSHYFDQYQ
jgi:hypothetical protein